VTRRKVLLGFILVHLPLVIGIYLGTSILPDYIVTRQQHLQQTNFFLTGDKSLITNPQQLRIAEDCQIFLQALVEEYDSKLNAIAEKGYAEYQSLKASNPDYSPYNLAGKYLGKIDSLEKSCRTKLNQYLKQSNLSPELVKQARYTYQIKKASIKQELYDMVKKDSSLRSE